jgi:hypothetical protein
MYIIEMRRNLQIKEWWMLLYTNKKKWPSCYNWYYFASGVNNQKPNII